MHDKNVTWPPGPPSPIVQRQKDTLLRAHSNANR